MISNTKWELCTSGNAVSGRCAWGWGLTFGAACGRGQFDDDTEHRACSAATSWKSTCTTLQPAVPPPGFARSWMFFGAPSRGSCLESHLFFQPAQDIKPWRRYDLGERARAEHFLQIIRRRRYGAQKREYVYMKPLPSAGQTHALCFETFR